jgi:hypothetical protein
LQHKKIGKKNIAYNTNDWEFFLKELKMTLNLPFFSLLGAMVCLGLGLYARILH